MNWLFARYPDFFIWCGLIALAIAPFVLLAFLWWL